MVNVQGDMIEILSNRFSPDTLKIKKGDTVFFINKDTEKHWPATDVHPSHKLYPGSDFKKCFMQDETELIFDACKGLSKDEGFSFRFNEIGTWNYHDHLKSSLVGKIIVE